MKLHTKILLGLIAGALAGGLANALFPGADWIDWVDDNVRVRWGRSSSECSL